MIFKTIKKIRNMRPHLAKAKVDKREVGNIGFTLVETILYISIVSILFLSLSSFIIFMTRIEEDSNVKWEIERESRKIITVFEDVLNNSTGVISPSSGNSDNQITFNGPILISIYLNSNNLEIDRGGNIEIINSDLVTISDFVIDNYSESIVPETIKINFTLNSEDSTGNLLSESFTTSFTLRDYVN